MIKTAAIAVTIAGVAVINNSRQRPPHNRVQHKVCKFKLGTSPLEKALNIQGTTPQGEDKTNMS